MNTWLLIVYLLTADGPREHVFELPNGQGRQCENWARELRLSTPVVREGIIYNARCVREYET